jgi:hypothetical protein
MPRIDIREQPRKIKEGPDRRGKFSKLLWALTIGQEIICPRGFPRHPHQTVYYHNQVARKEKAPNRWSVNFTLDGICKIKRVE